MFDNAPSVDGIHEIDHAMLQAERTRVRLVDVREPEEFVGELGHIPGAELVPLKTVAIAVDGWDKSASYVVVCRSGKRSATATKELQELGFSRVFNLKGGMLAWNDAKLPVER